MTRLREDAEKCAQLFSNICTGYNPNWGDTQVLLRALFRPAELERIVKKDAEVAQQAGGAETPWPANDPNRDSNNANERVACQTALRNLVEAIRACRELGVSWAKVQECKGQMNILVIFGPNSHKLCRNMGE